MNDQARAELFREYNRLGGEFWKVFTETIRDDVHTFNLARAEADRLGVAWSGELDFQVRSGRYGLAIFISTVPQSPSPFVSANYLGGEPFEPFDTWSVAVCLRVEGDQFVGYRLLRGARDAPFDAADLANAETIARFFLRPLLEASTVKA